MLFIMWCMGPCLTCKPHTAHHYTLHVQYSQSQTRDGQCTAVRIYPMYHSCPWSICCAVERTDYGEFKSIRIVKCISERCATFYCDEQEFVAPIYRHVMRAVIDGRLSSALLEQLCIDGYGFEYVYQHGHYVFGKRPEQLSEPKVSTWRGLWQRATNWLR